MTADARAIYQTTLDRLTTAILTKDADLWTQYIQLPHFMSTCDGKLVLETVSGVRSGLQDYCRALEALKVTQMIRSCDTARLVKEDTIVGFHTTEMLASDGTAYPIYPVRWVMHNDNGRWRVAKSDSALSAANWDSIPHNNLSHFEALGGDATKARRLLMQNFLDRIDSIFMSGDFDGWRGSVSLPLIIEARSGTYTFETEEALKQDFELYQREFKIHRVTDVARAVKTAEQVDDETMFCTYRLHVLSGSRYVVPPWNGAATLRLTKGRWRIVKIMGALGHLNWNTNAESVDFSF